MRLMLPRQRDRRWTHNGGRGYAATSDRIRAMAAWEWLAKGAKRVQELGAEYTQHAAIVERLLTLDAEAAAQQFSQVWQTLDDRSRAALKMTVAGLTLKQQAASTTPEAVT